jgi:hypothetical protein
MPLICFPILFIIKVDLLLFVSLILFQPTDGTFDDPLTECRQTPAIYFSFLGQVLQLICST